MNQGLHRNEKLKSRKQIEALFANGKTIKCFPIILVYKEVLSPQQTNFQVAFSVSKKKFKRAVDRNRVKRQMREAYRLQKNVLLSNLPNSKNYIAMFIFVGNTHEKTDAITHKIKNALIRLKETL